MLDRRTAGKLRGEPAAGHAAPALPTGAVVQTVKIDLPASNGKDDNVVDGIVRGSVIPSFLKRKREALRVIRARWCDWANTDRDSRDGRAGSQIRERIRAMARHVDAAARRCKEQQAQQRQARKPCVAHDSQDISKLRDTEHGAVYPRRWTPVKQATGHMRGGIVT